jgi:MarR family transcriptional regulator, lower aerobic nicotinate degradation pathway regulator
MRHTSTGQETPERLAGMPSRLLGLSSVVADRLVGQRLAKLDAHKWDYAVLASLREFGPASQATLSRRTGIYRSDLVALINGLTDAGLIERTPDPTDRRRNVISMTATGRRQLTRLDKVVADVQDELLEPLNRAEREQLVGLLTRVLDHHR